MEDHSLSTISIASEKINKENAGNNLGNSTESLEKRQKETTESFLIRNLEKKEGENTQKLESLNNINIADGLVELNTINNNNEINENIKLLTEEKLVEVLTSGNLIQTEIADKNFKINNEAVEAELMEELKIKNSGRKTKYGDVCLVFENKDSIKIIVLEKGKIFGNSFGQFKHDDMINRNFGDRIYNIKKDKYFVLILFLTNLYEKCLTRLTQILFNPDISLILSLLNIHKNSIVYESGTGSGCLSVNISQILQNGRGHLYTFEFNKERASKLNEVFKMLGYENTITCTHRDVVENGFELPEDSLLEKAHSQGDGIFIDLPTPWLVLKSVKKVLRSGGAFVSFSPCIEQVEETMKNLRNEEDFVGMRMYEIRYRSMGYSRTLKVQVPQLSQKRKYGEPIQFEEKEINVKMNKGDMRGHTGFLVYAIKI